MVLDWKTLDRSEWGTMTKPEWGGLTFDPTVIGIGHLAYFVDARSQFVPWPNTDAFVPATVVKAYVPGR